MKLIVQDELYSISGGVTMAKIPRSPLPKPLLPVDPCLRMLKPKPYFDLPIIRRPLIRPDV